MSAAPVDRRDQHDHHPGENPGTADRRGGAGSDEAVAGRPVVVRRHAGVAALVGYAASAVAIAYLWRASQTMAALDWALFGMMTVVAGAYLTSLVDARTPLLVADDLGVRLRLGHEWRGLPWEAIGHVVVRPRRGLLRDGRLVVAPRNLARALEGLDARARRHVALNQKVYGAPLAVPLGSTTRVTGSAESPSGGPALREGGVSEEIAALALGRSEVVVLDPETLEVVEDRAAAVGDGPRTQDRAEGEDQPNGRRPPRQKKPTSEKQPRRKKPTGEKQPGQKERPRGRKPRWGKGDESTKQARSGEGSGPEPAVDLEGPEVDAHAGALGVADPGPDAANVATSGAGDGAGEGAEAAEVRGEAAGSGSRPPQVVFPAVGIETSRGPVDRAAAPAAVEDGTDGPDSSDPPDPTRVAATGTDLLDGTGTDRSTVDRPTGPRPRRGMFGGLGTMVSRVAEGRAQDVGRAHDPAPTAPVLDRESYPAGRSAHDSSDGSDEQALHQPLVEETGGDETDAAAKTAPEAAKPPFATAALRQARPGLRAEARLDPRPTAENTAGSTASEPSASEDGRRTGLPEEWELRPGSADPLVDEAELEDRVRPISTPGEPVEPLVIDDYVTEPAYDPVIGPELMAARTRLGLSVDDLAEHTRIRPHVIESIEVDDFAPCGGDFYARGHLRTLARILGLHAGPLLERFEERYATAPINARRVFEAELATGMTGSMRSTMGGPSWGLLIGVVLVLVLVWGVLRLFTAAPSDMEAPVVRGSVAVLGGHISPLSR